MKIIILLGSILLISLLTVPFTKGMVAGVDFGGEYFKISLVKPGTPFEIVTNIHSKRKTETIVAFDGEDRLYGADALNVGVRRPQHAYSQVRRFLGSQVTHPNVMSLTKEEYHPYELVHNATRGSIGLKHKNDHVFHAEELVAMVFSHARDITNQFANGVVKDWVITVPAYFSQSQRQAILDAAEITGVRVLSLIEENTAAALQYAIDRVHEEKFRVLYYNMGSSSLQVSVVEYYSMVVPDGFKKNKTVGAFDVLSKTWDQTLGGAQFDLRLTEHLATQANEKLKIQQDIRTLEKPIAKLRAQARKTKIVLSANEQIPVVIQSLHNDRDFISSVNRREFEGLCTDLFEKALHPVERALEQASLTAADIDAVEIIGGSVRMPKIQQQLKDFFKKDLSVHLNGDEAMALGAAFRGANISNAFRVRTVGMNDISSFPMGVRLVDLTPDSTQEEADHWVKRAALFKEKNRLNVRKSVSFHHDKDISCTFRYDKPSELPPGVDSIIGAFNITGIEEFAASMKDQNLGEPKVTLSFLLDASGMMSIAKAEVTLEEELPIEEEPEVEETTEEKKPEEEEKTDEKEEEKKTEDEKKTEEEDTAEKEKEKPKKKKEPAVPKKKVHRKKLYVVTSADQHEAGMAILPMSIADKKESLALLKDMQKRDDIRIENAQAKNELESYVYKARDTLGEKRSELESAQVATTEQMDKLASEINDAEEWLYDDGENVDAAQYNERRRSMATKLEGMVFRLSESSKRPAAVKRVATYAATTRELMEEWEESKPQIKEDERKEVVAQLETLEKWVEEKEESQSKLKGHEVPAFTSNEVLTKLKDIKRYVSVLSKRPKPQPPKPEVNETSESKEETETTEEDTKADGETKEDVESKEDETKEDGEAKDEEETSEKDDTQTETTIHDSL